MKFKCLFLLFTGLFCCAVQCFNVDVIEKKFLAVCSKKCANKSDFEDKVNSANAILENLSDSELEVLYNKLYAKINNDEDPFSNQDIDTCIGLILANSTDEKLIIAILKKSPPQSVGFQDLAGFLEGLSGELLKSIVVDKARDNAGVDK